MGGTMESGVETKTLLNISTGAPLFQEQIPTHGRWFDTRKRSGPKLRVALAISPSRQSLHMVCTRALTPCAPRYFPAASLAACWASVPGGKTPEKMETKSKP